MKTFIEKTLCVSALLFAVGCAPSECKQSLPLIMEIETALAATDLAAARAPAEKLAELLPEKGKHSELQFYSEDLARMIEKSTRPVLTAEDREQVKHDVRELKAGIDHWKTGAKAWRDLCN